MAKSLFWLTIFAALLALAWSGRIRSAGGMGRAKGLEVTAGDLVCRPGGQPWSEPGSSALIIATSSTCPACRVGKPFDDEIADYWRSRGLAVFYVLAPKRENEARARELSAAGGSVIREEPRDLGIRSVPTIMRVDARGVVQSIWTGTVPESEHDAVFASLVSGSSLQGYRTVPGGAVPDYARDSNVQLLTLSPRGQRPGLVYKTIPVNELAVRAKYELDRGRTTLLGCPSGLASRRR
jgi:hypothetical protein